MRSSEMTPLVIGNVMYLTTVQRAVALEADTGKQIWEYEIRDQGLPAIRGLAYWPGDGQSPATVFFGTEAGFLIALNAATGKQVPGFGDEGVLNLKTGMTEKFPGAHYGLSSAPAIYKNLIITGSHVQEQPQLGPSGDIRAFDAHTGKLAWTFHTIPQPGEAGHETWKGDSWKDRSGANVWGVMTVDVANGLVFLPIGCATYDYYGGDREGANLYGDSLVALDAATGKVKWFFQTTHHDVWDRDLESAPVLLDVVHGGRKIPAVAVMTKQTLLFFFDRLTGKPIYPIEERSVPQDGAIAGEHLWPTQPFPVVTPPLSRTSFSMDELAKVTPEHEKFCKDLVESSGGIRPGGIFTPFNEKPTAMFPATLGGSNWHGASFDAKLGYLLVNTQSLGELFQISVEGERGPIARRKLFWDPNNHWPCQQPPWGEFIAVDVNTGKIAWRVPLGSFPELDAKGIHGAGTPNIGGSIASAGGVSFIGATLDNKFRAFDSKTGKELWAVDVGAAVHSIPITYQGRDGKQYVAVMVSGGGFLGDPVKPPVLRVYTLR